VSEDVKFLVDTEGCRDILVFLSGTVSAPRA
jgi:hypothetical protein